MYDKPISPILEAIIQYLKSVDNKPSESYIISDAVEQSHGFKRSEIQKMLHNHFRSGNYIKRDSNKRYTLAIKALEGDYKKPISDKPTRRSTSNKKAKPPAQALTEIQPKVNLDNIANRLGDVVSELMSANHEYRQALIEARDSLRGTADHLDSLLDKYTTEA